MAGSLKIWVNNSPPNLEDDDLNGFRLENNNLIAGTGQVLDDGNNQQTHLAVAAYAAAGDYFVDSGVVDAYVLSPVAPRIAPPALVDGLRVRFLPSAPNTGPSTVNYAGTGVKDVVQLGGAVLVAGLLSESAELVYDLANDRFTVAGSSEFIYDEDLDPNGDYTSGAARFLVKRTRNGYLCTYSATAAFGHVGASTATSATSLIPPAFRPTVTAYTVVHTSITHTTRLAVTSLGAVQSAYYDWAGSATSRTGITGLFSISWYVAD